jgi:TFIIB-like protein
VAHYDPSAGEHWDTEEIRKEREYGWIRQNEARLIAEAREKRQRTARAQAAEEAERYRRMHWKKCPGCGADMRTELVDGVEVEKCSSCAGIFFKRGGLEQFLLRHEMQRGGFFRQLLGQRGH